MPSMRRCHRGRSCLLIRTTSCGRSWRAICGRLVMPSPKPPNAETAVVLAHSIETLDLLLADIVAGPAVAERLRAERPRLPVLLTAGADVETGLSEAAV